MAKDTEQQRVTAAGVGTNWGSADTFALTPTTDLRGSAGLEPASLPDRPKGLNVCRDAALLAPGSGKVLAKWCRG